VNDDILYCLRVKLDLHRAAVPGPVEHAGSEFGLQRVVGSTDLALAHYGLASSVAGYPIIGRVVDERNIKALDRLVFTRLCRVI
jgi:hypothetical protein